MVRSQNIRFMCVIFGMTFAILATPGSSSATTIPLGDAANFSVLFEGAGNNHLQFNNGTIDGNIGLGDPSGGTPQLQLSGGSANTILNGNVLFAGAVNVSGTAGTDYTITASHTITGGHTNVQTDLNNLNSLSSLLGGEAGTSLAINPSRTQTINVSSGTLDSNGIRVFKVTSMNFGNNSTLIINGDASSEPVVFNFTNNASFGGTIELTGGLTTDQVLFNMYGGSGLTGGPTLTISTNGAAVTGVFLDPNGSIQMNHSLLYGRLFGGDTHDDAIVSGANIIPEPLTMVALGMGLAGLGGYIRRRRQAV